MPHGSRLMAHGSWPRGAGPVPGPRGLLGKVDHIGPDMGTSPSPTEAMSEEFLAM